MDFLKKNLVGLVAIVIAICLPLYLMSGQKLGGATNYDELDATAIKIGGSSGSRVGPVISNTCELIGTHVTQAGSSTLPYDCAVTGVVSGDYVLAQLATSTAFKTLNGWEIVGAKASTTSGFITVLLSNLTGGSADPSATSVASSTQYLVLHPRSTVPGL